MLRPFTWCRSPFLSPLADSYVSSFHRTPQYTLTGKTEVMASLLWSQPIVVSIFYQLRLHISCLTTCGISSSEIRHRSDEAKLWISVSRQRGRRWASAGQLRGRWDLWPARLMALSHIYTMKTLSIIVPRREKSLCCVSSLTCRLYQDCTGFHLTETEKVQRGPKGTRSYSGSSDKSSDHQVTWSVFPTRSKNIQGTCELFSAFIHCIK